MKKTTATTALAATLGLSAWTMTAALAVAPAEAPVEPAPVTAPAEEAPTESMIGAGQGEEGVGPQTDVVMPEWSSTGSGTVSCADVVGTIFEHTTLPEGVPPILDADGDGIMCEFNGDDDGARGEFVDLWEGAMPPLPAGYMYPNCDTAYFSGAAYPFPVDFPFSGAHLDPDGDGVACETNGHDDAAFTGVVEEVPLLTQPLTPPEMTPEAPAAPAPATQAPAAKAPAAAAPAAEGSQVKQVPVGGADTGVSESQTRTGLLAGGGALAALAGAGLLIRRARQH